MTRAAERPDPPSAAQLSLRRGLCGATIGVGLLLALLHIHPAGVVMLVLVGLPVAVATAATPAVQGRFDLHTTGSTFRFGAAVMAVILSAFGVTAAFGGAGIAMWLLVLAGGWAIGSQRPPRRLDRSELGPCGGDRPTPQDRGDATGRPAGPDRLRPVSELSDSELCWAWRNSFVAAQQATRDPDRLDRVSRRRQQYLDEIQRRDPGGFAAWLNAGARAASDPTRYVKFSDRAASRPASRPPDRPANG